MFNILDVSAKTYARPICYPSTQFRRHGRCDAKSGQTFNLVRYCEIFPLFTRPIDANLRRCVSSGTVLGTGLCYG